jgi:agmatine/peptidylarginine deiminase
MEEELRAMRTATAGPYRLVPLPLPAPIRGDDGRRLPATHANFLIINGAVLVPTYNDPTDTVALGAWAGSSRIGRSSASTAAP